MKKLIEPPSYLTLQKKYSQSFPDNQKVTLYYCEQLKKYFTLNYNKKGYEINENHNSIIDNLKEINTISEFQFFDGSSLNINQECANHILNLYENISEGKEQFEDYIIQSNTNFLNILKYCVNKEDVLNG